MKRAAPGNYENQPERFLSRRRMAERHALEGDVQEPVAERLVGEGLAPTLDVGCGEGRLGRLLAERGHTAMSLDRSAPLLRLAPRPAVRADTRAMPLRDGTFGSVAALYCLYHVERPALALREAFRVLRVGGLFVAATVSRFNDPELDGVLPKKEPFSFEAEEAAETVAEVFGDVEVERWDAPLARISDRASVEELLQHRGLAEAEAREASQSLPIPLTLTKRGALIFAYRR